MAQSIGKVNQNGTLNDGAFYSIQDVDVLMDGVSGDIDDIEDDIDDIEGNITTIGGNITSLTGRVEALEQGGTGGGLVILDTTVAVEDNTITISVTDTTAKEIYDGISEGTHYAVLITIEGSPFETTSILYLIGASKSSSPVTNAYTFTAYNGSVLLSFQSESDSNKPVATVTTP